MNVNNDGTTDEQGDEQQPVQGPPAASQRDVQEAELKAEEARERVDALEQALDDLVEDYEELQEEHEKALEVLDEQLEWFADNAKFGVFTGKAKRERSLKDAVKERAAEAIGPSED